MSAEQKITLDDGINNLAKEVESMMDRIDVASSATDQKNLLSAYIFCLIISSAIKNKDGKIKQTCIVIEYQKSVIQVNLSRTAIA